MRTIATIATGWIAARLRDERGATSAEYGVVAAAVVVACLFSVGAMMEALSFVMGMAIEGVEE